jgi:hypothetical protein
MYIEKSKVCTENEPGGARLVFERMVWYGTCGRQFRIDGMGSQSGHMDDFPEIKMQHHAGMGRIMHL